MAEQWKNTDNLRTMTSKFNDVVDEVTNVKSTIETNKSDTEDKITDVNKSITEVKESLKKEIDAITASDVGLGNVDNTADTDKPVSTAQQEAINAAKTEILNTVSDRIYSEEISTDELDTNGDDPEVSATVKKYINDKIQEIASQSGVVSYGIATTTIAGVVRASDDVNVDSETGKMTVPELANTKKSLQQCINGTAEVQKMVGDLNKLNTTNKDSIIAAINALQELLQEVNTSINTLNTLKETLDKVTLSDNDTVSITYNGAGYITNNGTEVHFTIPVNKIIPDTIKNVSVSNLKMSIRQNGDYIFGSAVNLTNTTVSAATISSLGFITITANIVDTARTTNNDTVGIQCICSIKFTE